MRHRFLVWTYSGLGGGQISALRLFIGIRIARDTFIARRCGILRAGLLVARLLLILVDLLLGSLRLIGFGTFLKRYRLALRNAHGIVDNSRRRIFSGVLSTRYFQGRRTPCASTIRSARDRLLIPWMRGRYYELLTAGFVAYPE